MEYKVLFSINSYDQDGDVYERGIFLHFGDTRIKVATTLEEFGQFVEDLSRMSKEIEASYLLS